MDIKDQAYQPYYQCFLNQNKDAKSSDYLNWIRDKHREFQDITEWSVSVSERYINEFTEWLQAQDPK